MASLVLHTFRCHLTRSSVCTFYCTLTRCLNLFNVGAQSFSGKLEFLVKDCDPETGEADEEGYEDSYVVCALLSSSAIG